MDNQPTLEQQAYTLLIELYMLIDDGDRHFFKQFELTTARFYILYHLGNSPGLSPNELSSIMFCDKSNITRLVRHMINRDWLEKRPHETDGRSIRLYLTKQGDALRTQVITAHNRYNQTRFQKMGKALPQTLRLLQQLKDDLSLTVPNTP